MKITLKQQNQGETYSLQAKYQVIAFFGTFAQK